jgi:lipid-A-disaccharide synthase
MIDVVILSNGPGEVTTWVYPVVRAITDRKELLWRISVVLSPCSHASGRETTIVQSFPGVARVLSPDRFWDFLWWGKTPGWDWCERGVVVFLGGDQFFTVAIGRRLGYKTLIYAEWEARWVPWIDRFALRHSGIAAGGKGVVIGDLMADITDPVPRSGNYLVFLPGSKGMKLRQGVPLVLAVADRLAGIYPDLEFYIALAPTLTPPDLVSYGGRLEGEYLLAPGGTRLKIHRAFPATELFLGAKLCITTVGANTAQLAALAVPMIVLLPTNQWDAMQAWDGLPGILSNLPGIGRSISSLINRLVVSQIKRRGKFLSWANIYAQKPIVPEYIEPLTPDLVATYIQDLLDQPAKLDRMRQDLQTFFPRSQAGAKLVNTIEDLLGVSPL